MTPLSLAIAEPDDTLPTSSILPAIDCLDDGYLTHAVSEIRRENYSFLTEVNIPPRGTIEENIATQLFD